MKVADRGCRSHAVVCSVSHTTTHVTALAGAGSGAPCCHALLHTVWRRRAAETLVPRPGPPPLQPAAAFLQRAGQRRHVLAIEHMKQRFTIASEPCTFYNRQRGPPRFLKTLGMSFKRMQRAFASILGSSFKSQQTGNETAVGGAQQLQLTAIASGRGWQAAHMLRDSDIHDNK